MSDWFEFVQAIYKCLSIPSLFWCIFVVFNCYPGGPLALHFANAQSDTRRFSHHNI